MKNHKGSVLWKSGKISVIDCSVCGFIHMNPIINKKKLEKMYADSFYQTMHPGFTKKYESELDYWKITFDDKLDIIENKIKKKNRKILDIGCGPGFFLKHAQKRKWDVLGIEPSTSAAKYARSKGVPIHESTFESFILENRTKFDAIHTRFFLEHTIDPKLICKQCHDILNPGGIICFEVPNDFNILQKIVTKKLKKPEYWIAPPEHINYFSLSSLSNLLQNSGFKLFYSESTFPLELFLLLGHDYLNNDKIGKKIHSMRMNFESHLYPEANELKRKLYSFFAQNGMGREIIIYAKKQSIK